jgi:hypothetical protein
MTPELIADVYLYPTDRSGKKLPIGDRYRCPCFVLQDRDRDILSLGGPIRRRGDRRFRVTSIGELF